MLWTMRDRGRQSAEACIWGAEMEQKATATRGLVGAKKAALFSDAGLE